MSRELLKQALDALMRSCPSPAQMQDHSDAIKAITTALAEPAPEPVAWMAHQNEVHYLGFHLEKLEKEYPRVSTWTPLYASAAAPVAEPVEPLRPCWYESNKMQVCVKCGQMHDKAIFPTPPPAAAEPVEPKCSPTLTECPKCKNDWRLCPLMHANRAAPPAAVPPGYVLVPVEPTEAMWRAGDDCQDSDPSMDDSPAYYIYKAMLAARPGGKDETT